MCNGGTHSPHVTPQFLIIEFHYRAKSHGSAKSRLEQNDRNHCGSAMRAPNHSKIAALR